MKHAYLIMCHDNIRQLNTLLSLLDYKNNDFFLHVDKKWTAFDLNDLNKLKFSNLYIVERMDIQWGGYSQIECELKLLKQAVNTKRYNYYHLISGQDLPLKTNKEIDDFFQKNKGKEFVRIQAPVFEFEDRVRYYYPIQKDIRNKYINMINRICIKVQKIFKIHRNKNIEFQKGTNWFSITDEFANFVLLKEEFIKETFHHTLCCDGIFLQTLLLNSTFKNNLYYKKFDNNCEAIMRYIDWERGNPYIFKNNDFDDLINSDLLLARKFDERIDDQIIQRIYEYLSDRKKREEL